MTDETTSSVSGTVCLDSDEVLQIQVKQEYVFRMQIYSGVIKVSEVGKYVDMDTAVAYGEKTSGWKKKFVFLALLAGLIIIAVSALGVSQRTSEKATSLSDKITPVQQEENDNAGGLPSASYSDRTEPVETSPARSVHSHGTGTG